MTTLPDGPRIPPLDPADRDEKARELLEGVGGVGSELNVFTTLVRHPKLFRRWSAFAGALLLAGRLPARDRELLILRTAWNNGCEYEWGQHVHMARDAGLDAEIDRVIDGPTAPGLAPFDAVLLRAADELHQDSVIGDDTWARLRERYDEHQLIEVPMLVGHYTLLGYTLNSLGVQREEGVHGFPTSRNTRS
ncbi:MAG TPA: carboxymuconolactone decarboxylase family protein [Acidimicrobiales bacterium]